MGELFQQADKPFCPNHQRTQDDIEKIKDAISDIRLKIERLENNKVEQEEMSDIQREIAKLSIQLETVVRDRRDDMKIIQQLREEVAVMSEELKHTAILNENLKVNLEYVVEGMERLTVQMDKIQGSLQINWLDLLNDFMNQNVLRKIFSIGTIVLIFTTLLSIVVWVWTGKNMFPYIIDTINSVRGIVE